MGTDVQFNVGWSVDELGVWLILPDATQATAEGGLFVATVSGWHWFPYSNWRVVTHNTEILAVRCRNGDRRLIAFDLERVIVAEVHSLNREWIIDMPGRRLTCIQPLPPEPEGPPT